jgi:hypothetical protein
MKRVLVFAIAALLVLPLAAGAQDKWVRGEVTAVTGNSFTVKTADGSLTFAIDPTTDIVAPGGATATREARKFGKEGTTLDKVIKAGDMVEVHYKDAAGKMMATEIRGGIRGGTATAAAEPAKGSSARGAVTALSDSSITVKGKDAEWTFAIDTKTGVIGRGVGTAAREAKEKGAPVTVTQLLKVGDEVTVRFTAKHADEIRLIYSAK